MILNGLVACVVLAAAMHSSPALAQPRRQPAPASEAIDWSQLASTNRAGPGAIEGADARPGKTTTPVRRLQLKGLGLKYQVNKSLAVEGGAQAGLLTGSPRAFISVQKAFGAR